MRPRTFILQRVFCLLVGAWSRLCDGRKRSILLTLDTVVGKVTYNIETGEAKKVGPLATTDPLLYASVQIYIRDVLKNKQIHRLGETDVLNTYKLKQHFFNCIEAYFTFF